MKTKLEDFKKYQDKFLYSELDDFGTLANLITKDFDSAGFIGSVSSLVFSIVTMSEKEYQSLYAGKHKDYQIVLRKLSSIFKRYEYRKLFMIGGSFMLYGYNNCCFLGDKKRFEKCEEVQPLYCDYLNEKTIGLRNYRFNPYIHVWIRALQTVYYQWMTINDIKWRESIDALIKHYDHDDDFPYLSNAIELPITLDEFNIARAVVHYIRRDSEHLLVANEIRNFSDAPERHMASAERYIDYLFSRYCKLLVLRIDLGYRQDAFLTLNAKETYETVRQDRDRFFANMRHKKKLFEHKVGFISKLEYGFEKGFHYHLILFLDGSKVQNHQYLSKEIKKYWNLNITKGLGNAYNCHDKIDEYKFKGIGKISYDDKKLRHNLIKYVAKYLIKPDLVARLVIPGESSGAHIFERGQFKKELSRRGRPRLKALSDQSS